MQVELIESWAALEPHRAEWQSLAGDHPFLQWDWLRRWWEAFGEQRSLMVLRLVNDEATDRETTGSAVAFAPFFREHNWLQGDVIRFLGSGRVCSDYLRLLCRDEDREAVGKAVANWLEDESSGRHPTIRWNLLELDGVVGEEPTVDVLKKEMESEGSRCNEAVALHVWRAELPATWNDYTSETLKSKFRKKFRKLAKVWIDSERAKLSWADSPEQVSQMLDQLIELHERRRASMDEDGCFGDVRFVDWMHHVCQDYFRSGNLRLSALDIDGQRVALAVGFEFGGVLYHYQTGIDPDALAMSPGFVLNIAIIQDAIQRGVQAIDFLRGDEHYKSMFGAQSFDCRRLRIVPANAVSLLRHRLWQAGGSVRRLVTGWR